MLSGNFLGVTFWLSASDAGRAPGEFHWWDGTPVSKQLWASGNPNAFVQGQETCVVLDMKDGRLRDWNCAKISYRLLCEAPQE
jgi:hypothetical protein